MPPHFIVIHRDPDPGAMKINSRPMFGPTQKNNQVNNNNKIPVQLFGIKKFNDFFWAKIIFDTPVKITRWTLHVPTYSLFETV